VKIVGMMHHVQTLQIKHVCILSFTLVFQLLKQIVSNGLVGVMNNDLACLFFDMS